MNQLDKPVLFSVVIQGYEDKRPDDNGFFAGKYSPEKKRTEPGFAKDNFPISGGGSALDETRG